MSKRFVPARIMGDSVVVERDPFVVAESLSFHGAMILPDANAAAGAGPYRSAPPRWRRVVVREVDPLVADDGHFLDLFADTIAETAVFRGTPAAHILQTLGRDGRVHAAVMEHLEGFSITAVLKALAARGAYLPIPVALAIAEDLLSLWMAAGSVRFYLGTDNVLLSPSGQVRAQPELASERSRQVAGAAIMVIDACVSYAAPEQLRDDRTSRQSGMFTLGLLLYEMLTSRHPVHAMGKHAMFEVLDYMVNQPMPPIQEMRGDIPNGLAAFVDRALAPFPMGRFPSWAAMRAELAVLRSQWPMAGAGDISAVLRSARAGIAPATAPVIDEAALDNWEELPNVGYVPVLLPEIAYPHHSDSDSDGRPAPSAVDPDVRYPGLDRRPMYTHDGLAIDARPVTEAEYQRFIIETSAPQRDGFGDGPRTMVTWQEAQNYAYWAGKRLPTEVEWVALVTAIGADKLATGSVWEWTATPAKSGHIVRGGRWRDARDMAPSPQNRSFETQPAADVGFRCVWDRA